MSSSKTSLTYKDSGVDINAGNELIEAIKDDVKKSVTFFKELNINYLGNLKFAQNNFYNNHIFLAF